jgi:hypothetical protein
VSFSLGLEYIGQLAGLACVEGQRQLAVNTGRVTGSIAECGKRCNQLVGGRHHPYWAESGWHVHSK